MIMRKITAAIVLTFGAVFAVPSFAQDGGPLVVTSLQPTYSLTYALAAGTSIRVENAPADGARMAAQERALFDDDLDALFTDTDAVVTIARVWREDLLYPAARDRNIRVVPIDAARPWNEGTTPVGLTRVPCVSVVWAESEACGEDISPFLWLSISNGVRMAEHIAADLERLAPQDTAKIQSNLENLVSELRDLKSEYDNRFALLPDPRVFALADEFVYLFGEMGVFVDGYFPKEDVRWTDEDLAGFEEYLSNGGPSIVVHKWEPTQPIMDAINRAGAKLLILDTGDPGIETDDRLDPNGYVTILRNDLDMLAAALEE
jgi:ABC-type Zn uptake system ZnuABC Zn-binding protein ZnuA